MPKGHGSDMLAAQHHGFASCIGMLGVKVANRLHGWIVFKLHVLGELVGPFCQATVELKISPDGVGFLGVERPLSSARKVTKFPIL